MERINSDELVYLYKKKNEEATIELINKFQTYIRRRIRLSYGNRLCDADVDEATNDTLKDVMKGVMRYRDDYGTSIDSYLNTIINNKLKTNVNNVIKRKHYKDYRNDDITFISLNNVSNEEYNEAAEMVIADPSTKYRPKEHLDEEIAVNEIQDIIKGCTSALEYGVIELTSQKYSNGEVAAILQMDIKKISNAKERARVKIRGALKDSKK